MRRLAVHAASFASIVTCPHESHPASVLRPAGGSRFCAFAAAADSPASVTLTARSRLRTPRLRRLAVHTASFASSHTSA